MASHDLLIEILTEELPPKRLSTFRRRFLQSVEQQLSEHQLAFLASARLLPHVG
ncbi:MAG: hypothetical protein LRY43_01880 [Gammaproteobacteria bacterium]|nr:hypothetical protein [Gammaproteobacteria bacterium]